MAAPVPLGLGRRDDLRADCSRCVGLCCVALAFARSADFAFDKPAGEPCTHLGPDYRCGIHPVLRERGFPGCTAFDCFGAGQKVTQQLFGGRSWRDDAATRAGMFAVFPIVRSLHELLWLLDEALGLPAARALRHDLEEARAAIERRLEASPERLVEADVDAQRVLVGPLLSHASALARAGLHPAPVRRGPRPEPGGELIGADFRGRDLRGADLRGALLIRADLTGADLRLADLRGADLRDANLSGADLSDALFVTPTQANAAGGDVGTRLPSAIARPAHWS
ncbi:pentapeptide repeat-containing protein [Lysobacter korlensis]|uniref:Pentapeptide repeat-containing protein n=1 Tax=Lysobacter korlensis TaxID=553636 RepID=A0ABV6RWZ7_9GAMM